MMMAIVVILRLDSNGKDCPFLANTFVFGVVLLLQSSSLVDSAVRAM